MAESTELTTTQGARPTRVYQNVEEAIAILDTARFEHMQRIATVMAASSLIPDCLRQITIGEGQNKKTTDLAMPTVVSNCFLITNQAVRWNMDPFAVAQCCSIVHGRLMYEGKLVAAVLETRAGAELRYEFGKWNPKAELCIVGDEGEGDMLGVRVSSREEPDLDIHGAVGIWKTAGNNSPWRPGAMKRQLRYRGAREWARAYRPAVMLGVITPDELDDLNERRFSHGPAPSLHAGFPEEDRRALEDARTPVAAQPSDDSGQSGEGQGAPAQEQGEAVSDPKPKEPAKRAARKPAQSAAPDKPTPDSATPASDASQEATSGQPQQDAPSNDGETFPGDLPAPRQDPAETRQISSGYDERTETEGREIIDHETGEVIDAEVEDLSEVEWVPGPFADVMLKIEAAQSWADLVAYLREIQKNPEYQALPEAVRGSIRGAAFAHYEELKRQGKEKVPVTSSWGLFRMWLDFAEIDSLETLEREWKVFWSSPVFKQANVDDQNMLRSLKAARARDLGAV